MATIEIHDGRGGASRRNVTRDQVIWVGSDAGCDIMATGSDVQPRHARIRWQSDRYRVEPSPAAGFIEVNGHRVPKAKLRQGDELRVGDCRVFFLQLDDGLENEQAPKTKAPTNTVVAPPVVVAKIVPQARPVAPAQAPPQPPPATAPAPTTAPKPGFDKANWLDELNSLMDDDDLEPLPSTTGPVAPKPSAVSPPPPPVSMEKAKPEEKAKPKSKSSKKDRANNVSDWTSAIDGGDIGGIPLNRVEEKKGWKSWFKRDAAKTILIPGQPPPQVQEKVAVTPLVVMLAIAIAIFIVIGVGIYYMIRQNQSETLFRTAEQTYEEHEYRNAIVQFDAFLAYAPKEKRADKAICLRHLADIKQFQGSWAQMQETLENSHPILRDKPPFEDYQVEFGDLAAQVAQGFAEQTARTGNADDMARTTRAVSFHKKVAAKSADAQSKRYKLTDKVQTAQAAVDKAAFRTLSLKLMSDALASNEPLKVYAARDQLIRRYTDFAKDKEVVDRLTRANEQFRKAVKFDESRRPAETSPLREILGPPLSLVIRDQVRPAPSSPGQAVFALADGLAYGVDALSGTPLWHCPVGLSSPYRPRLLLSDKSAVLMFDSRTNELVKRNSWTGKLIWRQKLEGAVDSPPIERGNLLFQTTLDGDLVRLDSQTGEVLGRLKLGRPIVGMAAAEESGQHLYLTANDSNIFVVLTEPPECLDVVYIGHEQGSIATSPCMVGPYLLISENLDPGKSRWRIFKTFDNGAKLQEIQTINHDGWVWGPPTWNGAAAWMATDRGVLTAFDVRPPEDKPTDVFKLVDTLKLDRPIHGPAYLEALTENEAMVSAGGSGQRSRNKSSGKLEVGWSLPETGTAAGPIQVTDKLATFTQRTAEGAIDLITVETGGTQPGKMVWRTILGAKWLAPPVVDPKTKRLLILHPDGQLRALERDQVKQGGFLEMAHLPMQAGVAEVLNPRSTSLGISVRTLLESPVGWLALTEPLGRSYWIVNENQPPVQVNLPITMAAPPMVWGDSILTVAAEGRIDLIDPADGSPRALPLVLPLSRSQAVSWTRPALLSDGAVILADRAGNLYRLVRESNGLLKAVERVPMNIGLAGDPAITRDAVIVATTDDKIQTRATRGLGVQGTLTLKLPLVTSPYAASGHVFAADASGEVVAYGPNGARAWSVKLTSPPIASPMTRGSQVFVLGTDGVLDVRNLADGKPIDHLICEVEPTGPAADLETGLAIPTAQSSYRWLER